ALEAFDVVSQLREVPAAERSGEAPQEDEHDRAVGKRLRKTKRVAVGVGQRKVGGGRTLAGGGGMGPHGLCIRCSWVVDLQTGGRGSYWMIRLTWRARSSDASWVMRYSAMSMP